MLEPGPNCECCDKDLLPDSENAVICTFECTFCNECAETMLKGKCPDCGGNFVSRPVHPNELLDKYPASTKKVLKKSGCATNA